MNCKRSTFYLLVMTFSLATGSHLFDKMVNYRETDGESKRSIGRIDVVYPSIETLRSGIKKVTFRAFDQDIELRLEPAGDVIADDFTIVDEENGEVTNSVDIQNLKRKLYRDEKMGAALYIDEDGPLIINGIINSNLRIEPDTSKEPSKNGSIPHRVIELIEDENILPDTEIVVPSASKRSIKCAESLSENEYVKINYLFIADNSLIEYFERNSWQYGTMETFLDKKMKQIQEEFDLLELGIKVAMSGIIKLSKENETILAPFLSDNMLRYDPDNVDAEYLLIKLAEFYSNSTDELIVNADIVVFITRRSIYKKEGGINYRISGLSYFNTICNNRYKYAVVDFGYNMQHELVDVSSHIIGCPDHDQDTCSYLEIKRFISDFTDCCKSVLEDMITKRKPCIIETYSEKLTDIRIIT